MEHLLHRLYGVDPSAQLVVILYDETSVRNIIIFLGHLPVKSA